MELIKSYNWSRRDFTGDYKCEFCNYELTTYGYDDSNFYQNVIPNMVCPECGKHSEVSPEVVSTRYPEGLVI